MFTASLVSFPRDLCADLYMCVYVQEESAAESWRCYEALTASLAQDLCEQLRLVLEPTQAAKLRYLARHY